jgi:hypothetical protein
MTVFVAIVYVRLTVIIKIFPCAFDAIVITLSLDILELLRWSIPPTSLSVALSWRSIRLSNHETGSGESNC